jgi:hypothetical protein
MKMSRCAVFCIGIVVSGFMIFAQSRGGNWPTYGGDAQRSGWEGTDASISRDSVKNLQLLWKIKLESQSKGLRPVMPPIVQGRLISYRGFKELAFVATNADIVYAIDADLGTVFWQKHLEYSTREPQVTTSTWACPGGLTAMPTMATPARGPAPARGAAPPATATRGSAFIGGSPSLYALSSDGRLHRLNTSTGDDMTQPISVLPANARAANLNMIDNVIYTVTSHECNDAPDAVWAIDLNVDPPKVRSFAVQSARWSLGGAILGTDGTVHVAAMTRPASANEPSTVSILSLSPRELKPAQQLDSKGTLASDAMSTIASPVVFQHKDREFVVSVCSTGRLCMFEGGTRAGVTTPSITPPIVQATGSTNSLERGIWGSLSTWQDSDGARWVFAPVEGPLHSDLKPPVTNGPVPSGSIVAFKVEEQSGNMSLTPAWVSRNLESPLPPVIANGVVFVLSAGDFARQIKTLDGVTTVEERPKSSTHATLYALDARTGKELYSSRSLVSAPASLTGMTVANGRVYFGGTDGSLYAFGMYMEH